jgi:riboflavin kinase/FMN adenylyltransferase
LSFNPHPRQFFSKNLDRYQIIGLEKKQQLLKKLGVTDLFSLHFDQSVANLSPSDFIDKIIVQKLQVKKLVVGYDFRFGKNREGDALLLRDHASIHGFSLEII